jgi:ribosomal protein L39E
MTRYKTKTKKIHLSKERRRTRWAPFWIVPKILRLGRRVHPSRFTAIKRHWRRTKIKL